MRWLISALVLCAAGCYESHGRDGGARPPPDAGESSCAGDRPVCVEPGDRCEPWRIVDTLCGDDLRWRCPVGAEPHERASGDEACRPFAGTYERLGAIGPEVPVGEGCAMLANGEVSTLGMPFEHLATPMGAPNPFGTCPAATSMPSPLLDRSFLPPDFIVNVMDTLSIEGETWSLVRLFVLDPEGGFGVTALGTSWLPHRSDGMFTPTGDLTWLDPVHRSAVVHDGFVYLYESSGEPGLSAPAHLSRAPIGLHTEPAAYEPVGRDLFDVGPHFAVTRLPSGLFVLTTIEGFGDTVIVRTAPAPEGPWSAPQSVHRCLLPDDDPEAFCDGAQILESRLDPTRPDEVAIAYRIGTLTPGWETRDPRDYWPPIVRFTLPR